MTPVQEVAFEHFKKVIQKLDGVELIDRWIAFQGSAESKEPDLGVGKSLALEACLIQTFGIDYANEVNGRRAAVEALRADLADKKAMLSDLDAGKLTLPLEQISSFRARVAELEAQVRQINASRT